MRINLYAQNRHIVIVDGVSLQGFEEGDFLDFEADGNEASLTKGGDGPSVNISVSQGGALTIGLNPTSPHLGFMYQLRQAQQSNPRLINIIVVTGVEEVIQAKGCGFAKLPGFKTGGPTQSGRKFPFVVSELKLDLSAVEALS